jgi:EAL domain-containing protein (putative c-di-GMP-specific phosphodiesterase class I)
MTTQNRGCTACKSDPTVPEITMAFQPIIDFATLKVFAYEALVRPRGGGTAAEVLGQITAANLYAFDQICRVTAITLAAQLGMQEMLSINFLPNAIYQPAACIQKTLEAANRAQFPLHRLIFEVSENEPTRDVKHLKAILAEYKRHGMVTAIDDFGAGHAGLCMLADFQPDLLKIDMALTRGIDADPVRYKITKGIIALCADLEISVVAEGVETVDEAVALLELGVKLFQGYLFAKPALQALPVVPDTIFEDVRRAHERRLMDLGGPVVPVRVAS